MVVVVVPPECAVVGAVVDWITALSWMVVGLVVGVGFFVVFRRFHTGKGFHHFDYFYGLFRLCDISF